MIDKSKHLEQEYMIYILWQELIIRLELWIQYAKK